MTKETYLMVVLLRGQKYLLRLEQYVDGILMLIVMDGHAGEPDDETGVGYKKTSA